MTLFFHACANFDATGRCQCFPGVWVGMRRLWIGWWVERGNIDTTKPTVHRWFPTEKMATRYADRCFQ